MKNKKKLLLMIIMCIVFLTGTTLVCIGNSIKTSATGDSITIHYKSE